MRKSVIALSLALVASFLALHSPASARCRPADGYTFARVGTGPVAPGGTVLLELTPVFSRGGALTLPETHVSLRGRGRPQRIALRTLAANLFAFDAPAAAGHYTISPASIELDVAATSAPAAVTSAPVLASPALGEMRIGTGTTAATLEVTGAPTAAIGEIVRWGSSSWFVSRDMRRIGPGRCVPAVPGYDAPPASGDAMTARHLDAAGGLGPETAFRAP